MATKQVTDKEALDALIKARAGLVLDHPFFGALALRLTPMADPSCKTAWTDGKTLGVNPTWFTDLSASKRKGLIAHEIMHCALSHNTRRGARKHKKWNEACDHAINNILSETNFDLPDGGANNPAFKNMSSEAIYELIPDGGDNGNDDGDGDGDGDGCGPGEVRDGGSTPDETQQQEEEWKQAVAQAANAAKMCGNVPGFVTQMLNELLRPKIDWRDVLMAFLDPTARDDYSWSKRNRRFQDVYLPSLKSEQVGDVVVVFDTSGSVSEKELNFFIAELQSIFSMAKPKKVYRLDVDTRVCQVEEYEGTDFDPGKVKVMGRGGTDFKPAFQWVEEQGITPECLIYFTDMECYSFPEEPAYQTFWVSTTATDTAPFGQVFRIEDSL